MKHFHIRRVLNLRFLMNDKKCPYWKMVSNCLWVFGSSFWSCGKSVCMNLYGYFGPTFGRRGSISCISKVSFIVGSSIFWSILSSNKGSVDSLRPFMVPSKKFAVDIFDQRLRKAFLAFPTFPLFLGCSMFWSILPSNRWSVDSLRPFMLAWEFEQDWMQPQNI